MKTKPVSRLLLVNLVFILSACAGNVSTHVATTPVVQPKSTSSATMIETKKTVGIIAIGHSGLTGENSDPNRPGQDARENSWATGTTTEVNSVYQRLVAVYPETAGYVDNQAQGGARAITLADQAHAALQQVPTPELVLIQTIDNDIRCDGSDPANITAFGDAVARALRVIVDASPNSHILIVSQPSRPAKFATAVARDPTARAKFSGSGICDLFDPGGSINPEHIATLTSIIESYEAEQARICATVPQCSTDGGAFSKYVDDISRLAPDFNHLSVKGHARLAEIIWPVVSHLLGLK